MTFTAIVKDAISFPRPLLQKTTTTNRQREKKSEELPAIFFNLIWTFVAKLIFPTKFQNA